METDSTVSELLIRLFEKWSGEKIRTISALPESGSYRYYARIIGESKKAIAVNYTDLRENRAFIGFARHFRSVGLPIPEIYAVSDDQTTYLQEDFGDEDLFALLHETDTQINYPEKRKDILEQVIRWLPRFQIEGHRGLDYSLAYPRRSFDKQSMLWDLNYFKYNFLKLVRLPFDEQALEDDFHSFSDFLCQAPTDFFLYRDFQSRNIMVFDNRPGFIDFQGGRMGFPAYDLASLLFDAKAGFSPEERDWQYQLYRENLASYQEEWASMLDRFYPGFILIRKMQALGAFGFRGLIENKRSFLLSIPPAMINLEYVTTHYSIDIRMPEMWKVLCELPHCPGMKRILSDINKNHSGS
jgi:aminoglycoside/choline kinase family phosphotransferase